jgi:type VI secretion system protein ImpA
MRFDFLREPISESSPCGPDLDLEMDDDYTNYMLLASGRLPSRFFDDRTGAPFDRSTIDLDAEVKAIRGFLDQTRDARLITLDLRFHALRGEVLGFSEAVQGLAILAATFWAEFHPQLEDGDIIFRMNAVEAVDDQVQVVLPLQYAPLNGPGRSGSVSLRNYLVASGEAPPREGEEGPSIDMIAQIMGDERQVEGLTATHEAIVAALAALAELRNVFLTNGGTMPGFDRVVDVLRQMDAVIGRYRPEIAGTAAAGDEEGEEEESADGTPAPRRSSARPGAVKSHQAADAALRAAEVYFLRNEPSSPVMVLLHQARLLIGRPMVEALSALLPDSSGYAAFRFSSGREFSIGFSLMQEVTSNALEAGLLEGEEDEPEPEPEPPPPAPAESLPMPAQSPPALELEAEAPPAGEDGYASEEGDPDGEDGYASAEGNPDGEAATDGQSAADEAAESGEAVEAPATPVVPEADSQAVAEPPPAPPGPTRYRARTREEANDLMLAVEAFFKTAEPSSPVPLLLAKARNYLNKDFSAILGDLLPES